MEILTFGDPCRWGEEQVLPGAEQVHLSRRLRHHDSNHRSFADVGRAVPTDRPLEGFEDVAPDHCGDYVRVLVGAARDSVRDEHGEALDVRGTYPKGDHANPEGLNQNYINLVFKIIKKSI